MYNVCVYSYCRYNASSDSLNVMIVGPPRLSTRHLQIVIDGTPTDPETTAVTYLVTEPGIDQCRPLLLLLSVNLVTNN